MGISHYKNAMCESANHAQHLEILANDNPNAQPSTKRYQSASKTNSLLDVKRDC